MKENDLPLMVLVPVAWLKQLEEKMDSLMSRYQEPEVKTLGGWISEEEAKKLLGRETTWFWQKRKVGELRYTKAGNKIFYEMDDLKLFLERNKRSAA